MRRLAHLRQAVPPSAGDHERVERTACAISNDLRGVINVVRGSADLARGKLEPDHPAAADVARINRACEELAALTMELRAMSVSTAPRPPTTAAAVAPAPLR